MHICLFVCMAYLDWNGLEWDGMGWDGMDLSALAGKFTYLSMNE